MVAGGRATRLQDGFVFVGELHDGGMEADCFCGRDYIWMDPLGALCAPN
jgi:hypothetical protein